MIKKAEKIQYRRMSQDDINELFKTSALNGDLNRVKYFLTSTDLRYRADIHVNNDIALRWATMDNHFPLIKYLLTSPDLTEHANINADNDIAFREACAYGHLKLIQYFLTSPNLKIHADIHVNNNCALMWACNGNQLEAVKYLLSSPELKEHAHIDAGNKKDDVLTTACYKDNVEIVKYLLTSPELYKNANIYGRDNLAFKHASWNDDSKVIKYLIFEYKIECTKEIEEYLERESRADIIQMFTLRVLNRELEHNLTKTKIETRKQKI